MNILYLNNSMHLGGDNKCILKLCKELRGEHQLYLAGRDGVMRSDFEALGVKTYFLKDVTNKRPDIISHNVKKIIEIVKTEKIDVIHSHHRMCALTAKLAARFVKVKVIHTQHLCIEDKFMVTNLALRNLPIITVSEAAKNILVTKSKLNPKRITTIYNAIETEITNNEVDPILEDLKAKGHFIVGQVSRVIHYKGIYDFVEVAKKTVALNSNIRFVFMGDGPEFTQLQACIQEHELGEYVYLLGSKTNVLKQLEYLDLLILCSYIEGLPLAPLEAFSKGIPVVATNIDGTNEEIIDGYNGYLLPKKDTSGFADRIVKLATDDALLTQMSEQAKTIYHEKFDVKQYVDNYLKAYLD